MVRRDELHWYRIHMGQCPVCGRSTTERERVAGKRPDDPRERYVWISDAAAYDGCMY